MNKRPLGVSFLILMHFAHVFNSSLHKFKCDCQSLYEECRRTTQCIINRLDVGLQIINYEKAAKRHKSGDDGGLRNVVCSKVTSATALSVKLIKSLMR